MKRLHVPVFLFLVFGLNLLVVRWSTVAADSAAPDGPVTQIPIEHEVEFRQSIGFRSDEAYIKAIRARHDSIALSELGGVVLTRAEFEELQARLDLEKDVNTLLSFFDSRPRLENALGGMFIEHSAGAEDYTRGGRLVLQLVEGRIKAQDVLPLVDLRRPERLQIQWVRFSQRELEQQYERLTGLRSTAFQAIFMHIKLNRVGVIVDLKPSSDEAQGPLDKAALPADLAQQVSHPAVVVYNGRLEVEQVVVRGGDSWGRVANERICTFGFKVRLNTAPRYGMVTAGHCITEASMEIGDRVYSGSKLIGYVNNFIDGASSPYGAGIDAAFIRTRTAGASADDIDYFSSHFDVVGDTSDYTIGSMRCFTGQISGTKCSPITCTNQEYSANGKYYTRLFTVDADNIKGDSGSPVYEVVGQTNTVRVTGVLITRMRDVPGHQSCLNGWDGGASRWGDVASYLNLSLVTK